MGDDAQASADGRHRAARMRHLLAEAVPFVEAGLAAGLPRGAPLDVLSLSPNFPLGALSPEARALAAAVYKRGNPNTVLGWATSLCAPCYEAPEADLLARFQQCSLSRDTLFIVDAGFAKKHPTWQKACEQNLHVWIVSPEKSKTPEGLQSVLLQAEKLDSSFHRIIAIGGGATSDLAGLVAGLLALPFEVVPTTYLAAVDAGQGGKTGINVPPYGKNQLGLFHGATAFHLVPETFTTLPEEERASGFGEALKHCFLFGRWPLSEHDASFESMHMAPSFLRWNMEAKALVVNADPRESHVRKLLNLGHTFGHVWEGLQEKGLVSPMPHGVCVAWGMRTLERAGALQGAPESFLLSLNGLVERFSPRLLAPLESLHAPFLALVAGDKKNSHSHEVTLVTPRWGVLASNLTHPNTLPSFVTRSTPEEGWQLFVRHAGLRE